MTRDCNCAGLANLWKHVPWMASPPTEPAPQPPSLSGVEVQSWQNRALEERSRRRYRLFAPSSSESAATTPPAPDSVAASVGLESPRESTAMVSHSDPTQPRVVTPSSRLPSTPLAPLTRRAQLWLRLRPHVSALLKAGLAGRDAVGPYWTVAPPRRFRATIQYAPFTPTGAVRRPRRQPRGPRRRSSVRGVGLARRLVPRTRRLAQYAGYRPGSATG